MVEYIEIDGSTEEGGGQILRTALALSAVLGKPFKLKNIRSKRPKPGLQPQHLMGVGAAAQITNAVVERAKLNSTELEFTPQRIIGGRYDFDIGTAGSVTLLLQTILPILVKADRQSQLKLFGGTHVPHSPTIDYYEHVFLPLVGKFNVSAKIEVDAFGWYPKGGGSVSAYIRPSELSAADITDRGGLLSIQGICALSNLPDHILTREEAGIRSVFSGAKVEKIMKESRSQGTAVTVWAEFENSIIGALVLGKKGLPAEDLGRSATTELKKAIDHSGSVDEWMADQLLIYMALAKGKSSIKVPHVSSHMKTCMQIIPMFTNIPFDVKHNTVSVEGIGN